jgi:DNA-directed RNA polymerase subunit H (RpoH/RPB5)
MSEMGDIIREIRMEVEVKNQQSLIERVIINYSKRNYIFKNLEVKDKKMPKIEEELCLNDKIIKAIEEDNA